MPKKSTPKRPIPPPPPRVNVDLDSLLTLSLDVADAPLRGWLSEEEAGSFLRDAEPVVTRLLTRMARERFSRPVEPLIATLAPSQPLPVRVIREMDTTDAPLLSLY
jgi:hypothetical protein